MDPVSTFSNMNTRQSAIRIKHLPPGTVKFETQVENGVRGVVTKEAQRYSSSSPTRPEPVVRLILNLYLLPVCLSALS